MNIKLNISTTIISLGNIPSHRNLPNSTPDHFCLNDQVLIAWLTSSIMFYTSVNPFNLCCSYWLNPLHLRGFEETCSFGIAAISINHFNHKPLCNEYGPASFISWYNMSGLSEVTFWFCSHWLITHCNLSIIQWTLTCPSPHYIPAE